MIDIYIYVIIYLCVCNVIDIFINPYPGTNNRYRLLMLVGLEHDYVYIILIEYAQFAYPFSWN